MLGKTNFSKVLLTLVFLLALTACSKASDPEPADTGKKDTGEVKEDEKEEAKEDDGLYSIDDFRILKRMKAQQLKAVRLLTVSFPILLLSKER